MKPTAAKSSSRQATHRGTCQICGSFQLLPEGVLSKHGYTVKWGFFSGVCSGSGRLPFEQSTDAIEAQVTAVKAQIVATKAEIAKIEDLADPVNDGSSVWAHVYAGYGYQWVKSRLVDLSAKVHETFKSSTCSYLLLAPIRGDRDLRHLSPAKIEAYDDGLRLHTLPEWARFQNRKYAEAVLKKSNSQRDQWLSWQFERLLKWAPAPLTPRG